MNANPNRSAKTQARVQTNHIVLSTHGGDHQGGSEGEPSNPRLWHAIVTMARARFAKYPSPAAAHWVHQQYVLRGGQFIQAHHRKKR